jgi:transposase
MTPMPRPKGSADLLEHRRRRALALLGEGRSLHEVARLVACAASSVMRWRDARARGGPQALKVRTSPGRPPKLGKRDHPRLVRLLLKGAIAHGHPTDLWTTTRIARLIRRKFGVRYHGDHVGRLMHHIGWSHQKPERRALERDEEAIAHWKRREWPRVKKTLPGWAPTSSLSMNRGSC